MDETEVTDVPRHAKQAAAISAEERRMMTGLGDKDLVISDADTAAIAAVLADTESDVAAFCNVMGVARIADIPQRDLGRADEFWPGSRSSMPRERQRMSAIQAM